VSLGIHYHNALMIAQHSYETLSHLYNIEKGIYLAVLVYLDNIMRIIMPYIQIFEIYLGPTGLLFDTYMYV